MLGGFYPPRREPEPGDVDRSLNVPHDEGARALGLIATPLAPRRSRAFNHERHSTTATFIFEAISRSARALARRIRSANPVPDERVSVP
jgi:hypothetical protein